MKTDFCVFCGEADVEFLEDHHIIPRVEGGTDDIKNILTCCCECHGTLHEVQRPKNLRELQRLGKELAKKKKHKPKIPKRYEICKDGIWFCMYGTKQEISDYLNISRPTFYKILNSNKLQSDLEERAWELRRLYPRNQNKICELLDISRPTLYKILNGKRITHKGDNIYINVIL